MREYGDGPIADEYEALVSLCLAFDADSRADGLPPEAEPRLRRWLDVILQGHSLVAWDGTGAVGTVVLLPDGDRGHELAVYVHPEYHRRGVGSRLVETALSAADTAGIERVELITMGDNYGMIALAQGQGFEVTGQAAGQIEMALTLPIER